MLHVRLKKRRGAFLVDAAIDLPTPGVAALFGRSGSGKTTLVNLIAGLLNADEGMIELDGEVLFDTAAHVDVLPEHRRIGYVFQDARLFPHLRVAANLRYAATRAAARAAKGRAGGAAAPSPAMAPPAMAPPAMAPPAMAPPVSFDAVVDLLALAALLGRRPQQLSGGEKQRVAIARALLSQPRLLLLDEPLAAVDTSRREEVLPYLETLRDELAIPMVYVSHQFDDVLRLATHVVLMEAGTTVAQGPIGPMSLRPELRAIVGAEAVGAVIDGEVLGVDETAGLVRVRVGAGELKVRAGRLRAGAQLRVQILARDVIVATAEPRHLSVRNRLPGTVIAIGREADDADLISIDVGGAVIQARVTTAATRELALAPGVVVWALIKSDSLRGRATNPRGSGAASAGAS
jgi:molybdate transport system ATP-binding protein